jgi:hypothetical protein
MILHLITNIHADLVRRSARLSAVTATKSGDEEFIPGKTKYEEDLYLMNSRYYGLSRDGETRIKIGLGLFCTEVISRNDIVCYFSGRKYSRQEQINKKYPKDSGIFVVEVNNEIFIDGAPSNDNFCWASFVNSSEELLDSEGEVVDWNCTLEGDQDNACAFVRAAVDIPANTELLFDTYGSNYWLA